MLVISSLTRDHDGNYSCTAQNQAGLVTETTVLRGNGMSLVSAMSHHRREADMKYSEVLTFRPHLFIVKFLPIV